IWRDPAADQLEEQLDGCQRDQQRCREAIAEIVVTLEKDNPDADRQKKLNDERSANRDAILQLFDRARKIEDELVIYRAKTRRIAIALGIAVGTLSSAVGFRVLQNLVEATSFQAMGGFQKGGFVAVEVLLTGTLLAGGSLAVHQVFAVYDTFMN